MLKKFTLGTALALGLLVGPAITPASADNHVAKFYKGRTITIAIGYGFGGTYGRYSRTFAEFLPKYIPGHPTVILQSHPGAGVIKMTNYAYTVMPRQGSNLLGPPDMT